MIGTKAQIYMHQAVSIGPRAIYRTKQRKLSTELLVLNTEFLCVSFSYTFYIWSIITTVYCKAVNNGS